MILTESHHDIGRKFQSGELVGVCDRVEILPANYTNIETGRRTADHKIRLRLKPEDGGKARWTTWFPYHGPVPQ